MIKIIRTSDKKTEGDETCLASFSAEHQMSGAGPTSQCSKTKIQSGKLYEKEKEERREGEGQQAGEEVRDTGTTNRGVSILPKEQRDVAEGT